MFKPAHLGTPLNFSPVHRFVQTCSLGDPPRTCWKAGGLPSTERLSCKTFCLFNFAYCSSNVQIHYIGEF